MNKRAILALTILAVGMLMLVVVFFVRADYVNRITDTHCRDQHAAVHTFRLFLEEGSRQFELRPTTPAEDERLRQFRDAVRRYLNHSDCIPPGHKPHDPYSVIEA